MKTAIVTDSAFYMNRNIVEECQIKQVPLTLMMLHLKKINLMQNNWKKYLRESIKPMRFLKLVNQQQKSGSVVLKT